MSLPKLKEHYYTVGNSPFTYVGHRCNNRCIFCFEADRHFNYKSTDQIKEEIRIIKKEFNYINFMGQEPTLRKDIVELINYANQLKFDQIGITTNGRMFTYLDFTRKMFKSGLSQVVLTVAGCDKNIHDLQTLSKGSFDDALKGLKNILIVKKPEDSLIVNIMITQLNYFKLPEMIRFYTDLGIQEINIGHVLPLNRRIKKSKKIVAQMKKVVPYLIKIQEDYNKKAKFLFIEYPACIFPIKFRHLAFPCLEENPQKIRINICKKCNYADKCTGIDKDYIKLYGQEEFKL